MKWWQMLRHLKAALLSLLVSVSATAAGDGSRAAEPLRIHIISGSKEYGSEASLKPWKEMVEKKFRVVCTASWATDGGRSLEGIDSLAAADVMLVFARRLKLDEETLAKVRAHWEAGKPVVGLRTASHAFSDEVNKIFDREVLGNHYTGHFGNELVKVEVREGAESHPVLEGVGEINSRKLYKAGDLPDGTTVLQTGDNGKAVEPVTLVGEHRGGRVFYTSLGVQTDFENPHFLRILENALFWVAGKEARDFAKE